MKLKFNGKDLTVLYNVNKDLPSYLLKEIIFGRKLCFPPMPLPKFENISFQNISMIYKESIKLSMNGVNAEIRKGYAGRNHY